jgi:hypothetical protein
VSRRADDGLEEQSKPAAGCLFQFSFCARKCEATMMRGARPCDSESGLRFCFGRGLLLCPPTDLTARLQSRRGPRPVKSVTGTSTTQSLWGYRRLPAVRSCWNTAGPASLPPLMLHLHVLRLATMEPPWICGRAMRAPSVRAFLVAFALRRSGSYGRR